ncbi:hypothetical protein AB7M70_011832 [Bradyrhizobium japonicum]
MTEVVLKEYKKLSDKVEEQCQLTVEELNRLNQLHVTMLKRCYECFLRIEEEQGEVKNTIDAIWQAWYENELVNAICIAFLEDKGLTDEFLTFLKSNVDEIEGELFYSNAVN